MAFGGMDAPAPDPAGEVYNAPKTPSWIRGREGDTEGWEFGKEGKGTEGRGRGETEGKEGRGEEAGKWKGRDPPKFGEKLMLLIVILSYYCHHPSPVNLLNSSVHNCAVFF